jgi:hypothetical protein
LPLFARDFVGDISFATFFVGDISLVVGDISFATFFVGDIVKVAILVGDIAICVVGTPSRDDDNDASMVPPSPFVIVIVITTPITFSPRSPTYNVRYCSFGRKRVTSRI